MNRYIINYRLRGTLFMRNHCAVVYGDRIEQAVAFFVEHYKYDTVLSIYRHENEYNKYIEKLNDKKR